MAIDKDSEAIVFAQVDANLDSNPKIRKAGTFGRQVFEFILRRNALRGFRGSVPIAFIDSDYLADVLMIAVADAVTGVTKAVTANLIAIDDTTGTVQIVGWHESWGKRAKEGKDRTREWRERKRLEEHDQQPSRDDCDDLSSRVTTGDKSDAKRREEKRREIPNSHAPRAIVRTSTWERHQAWWGCMLAAHDRLRAKGIKPNTADLAKHPNEQFLAACERYLRDGGYDEAGIDAKMRHVVLVHEAEAEKLGHLDFFKPATIWDTHRPDRFPRKVDTSLEEAQRGARSGASSRGGPRRSGELIGAAPPRNDHPISATLIPIRDL